MSENRKPHIAALLIWLASLAYPGTAALQGQTIWHVDDDCSPPGSGTKLDPFCAIQQGVDTASDGDTVLVAPGVYTGDGNRDISLFGKKIWLKSLDGPSATTLDIQGGPSSIHRGFFLIHGETAETVIDGFTITNGYLIGDTGGSGAAGGGGGAGIYIRDSSPHIRNCVVRNNVSNTLRIPFLVDGRGGGIYVDGNSDAVIENCTIAGNSSEKRGSGIYVGYSMTTVSVRNCLFINNQGGGGTFYNTFAATSVVNTSIVLNVDAIGLISENSSAMLTNSILWGNVHESGVQLRVSCPNVPTIEYTDVQERLVGGVDGSCGEQVIWGLGNIDADPLFVDAENGDFRLLAGSPCIDSGNNLAVPGGVETDFDGLARFVDDLGTADTGNPGWGVGIVDMGPFEFGADDCNNNGVPDSQDVADGAADCDANGVPDECQPDCNENEQADACEEIGDDCDGNGRMDQCDTDCNGNGQPDACDLADGVSDNCNFNHIPDECEEGLGPPITTQPASQEVELGGIAFFTVVAEGVLLEYQWRKDGEDLGDTTRIFGTETSTLVIIKVEPGDAGDYDCLVRELLDGCLAISDVATLTITGLCPADFDGDGDVDAADLAELLLAWGQNPGSHADFDGDGDVDAADLAELLLAWGVCP